LGEEKKTQRESRVFREGGSKPKEGLTGDSKGRKAIMTGVKWARGGVIKEKKWWKLGGPIDLD